MHTVRIANLVTPTSGGIRTTLSALRHADVAAGHRVTEIVAGPAHDHEVLEDGTERRTLPGRPLPGGAGYRVLTDRTAVRAALATAAADHVEVHDRTTLGWVAGWARARGLSATVVVHERSLGALRTWARVGPVGPPDPLLRVLARSFDAALVATAGRTVVASRYAARAFAHVPTADVEVVRWGGRPRRLRARGERRRAAPGRDPAGVGGPPLAREAAGVRGGGARHPGRLGRRRRAARRR